jgi:hypothetical protein
MKLQNRQPQTYQLHEEMNEIPQMWTLVNALRGRARLMQWHNIERKEQPYYGTKKHQEQAYLRQVGQFSTINLPVNFSESKTADLVSLKRKKEILTWGQLSSDRSNYR